MAKTLSRPSDCEYNWTSGGVCRSPCGSPPNVREGTSEVFGGCKSSRQAEDATRFVLRLDRSSTVWKRIRHIGSSRRAAAAVLPIGPLHWFRQAMQWQRHCGISRDLASMIGAQVSTVRSETALKKGSCERSIFNRPWSPRIPESHAVCGPPSTQVF